MCDASETDATVVRRADRLRARPGSERVDRRGVLKILARVGGSRTQSKPSP